MSHPTTDQTSPRHGAARRLPRTWAQAGIAFMFGITMLGTTLPTPLYPAYAEQFGFGNLTTTLIYSVYAGGVLAALVLLGRASDVVGRRPMLLAGLAVGAASAVVFLTDADTSILFVGRVLSGLSAGIVTGTATVTIVELARPGAGPRASLMATAVNMVGLGLGPLLAGALAQWAPAPLRLPYAAHLVLLAVAFVAVWFTPETVTSPGRRLPRPQRLSVAPQARAAFIPAALVAFAAFAVFGLLTAIEPAILGQILHIDSPALAGLFVFTMFAGSAIGQIGLARFTGPAALPTGCLVLIAGLGGIATTLLTGSIVTLILGNIVIGVGQGIAFRAGVAAVTAASDADRRAEAMSLYFVIVYMGISVPVILAGVAAAQWDLRTAGVGFAIAVAAVALAALLAVLRLNHRAASR